MKDTFTIFYAWQSDHPGGQCRHLIAESLNAAANVISDDSSVPFCIEVDQDTKGVPGLCDIPAAILAKIEKCDALVADLTYVSKSSADSPRFCSNPNVLFEVGFAFHAIQPERLILVMNEHHGPKTNQIFDLDHRRHPVAYSFPGEYSRGEVIGRLAKDLELAIRPIVSLGRRADTTPSRADARHKEIERLRGELDHLAKDVKAEFCWDGTIYPVHDRRCWTTLAEVEAALRKYQARDRHGHEYPPQVKGNERREWGIANSLYGEPWIATKSGVFLCRQPMDVSQGPFPPAPRYVTGDQPRKQIAAGKWVDILTWREEVFTFFDFAQRWSSELSAKQKVFVELHAHIKGLHLVARRTTLERFVEMIEPSVASEYQFTRELTVEQLQTVWKNICAEAIDAFVELFPLTMGEEFPSSWEWVTSGRGR